MIGTLATNKTPIKKHGFEVWLQHKIEEKKVCLVHE
jgi:hypothetical protein